MIIRLLIFSVLTLQLILLSLAVASASNQQVGESDDNSPASRSPLMELVQNPDNYEVMEPSTEKRNELTFDALVEAFAEAEANAKKLSQLLKDN